MKYFLLLLLAFTGSVYAAESKPPLIECPEVMVLGSTPTSDMKMPTDVTIDKEGKIYVVDSGNNRIIVYSPDGKYLQAFGSEGSANTTLKNPVGIAATADGHIMVADRGNQRIQIYTLDGKHLKTIEAKVGNKKYTPVDVAMDRAGTRIFVTASEPFHQVIVLDTNGKLLSKWGKAGSNEGEFRFPATIALSRDEDEIYFVDVLNTRVQAFDMDGHFLVTVGSWGVTPGKLFRPKGVAIMKDNSVLVSDSYLGVVQLYKSDTRFRAVLGIDGKIARFNTPTGLDVDDKNRVYIVEMLANRVTVCQLAQ